ncbi:hypothetical protein BGZ76_004361 [Entomortierella beljakovae]|nr:hypothetical protein BGZ76_004361 [Entomortierella beljakovae]
MKESQKPHEADQETIRNKEANEEAEVTETSSSSDAEDLALLEEVNRIKARLEAKLQAKQLRKVTKSNDNAPDKAQATITSNKAQATIISDKAQATITQELSSKTSSPDGDSKAETNIALIMTPRKPHNQQNSESSGNDEPNPDMTTPTKTSTLLVSPGFRTPSPPPRSRYFMSPPSGSSSRKRQHSPSPLPRRGSLSLSQRSNNSTPVSARKIRTLGGVTGTPEKRLLNYKASDPNVQTAVKGTTDLFQDLFDEDLDDAFLDELLDNEGLDQPASDGPAKKEDSKDSSNGVAKSTNGDGSTKPTLTEVVQAQRQKQETQAKHRSTFRTLAAACETLSPEELEKLGHAEDYDPITKLQIMDRITTCEDTARMTHNLRIIPIKDGEKIRENSVQRLPGGVLRLPRLGTLPGKSDDTNSKTVADAELKSWLVAGVVGAKSTKRVTSKKVKYCQFHLCDLQSSHIVVFMFKEVMEKYHDIIRVGDIVAIMDPKVLHQAERSGVIGVQVEHPDCLLILGTSSSFGQCEAIKLNGDKCGRALDKRGSAYCNYHVMMAANRHRNQRSSLIVGTSSIYDIDKAPLQSGSNSLPRNGGTSRPALEKSRISSKETTYIFDDGGVGTSSMVDSKSPRNGSNQPDTSLSNFLMSQNNLGGQYLRQAKASKDVAWAKDVSSPKTPTNSSELFPAEMIRRMGYDPVTGQFVPGSPKRRNDDLQARERSIRLLTERVKSPPAPMRSLSDTMPLDRKRTIDIKGTTRSIAQPRSVKSTAAAAKGGREVQEDVFFGSKPQQNSTIPCTPAKKWVDLDDGSCSSDSDDSPLLSLSQQRTKNLQESRGRPQVPVHSIPSAKPAAILPKRKATLSAPTSSMVNPFLVNKTPVEGSNSQLDNLEPKSKSSDLSSSDTQPCTPASQIASNDGIQVAKKQRYIELSDSE